MDAARRQRRYQTRRIAEQQHARSRSRGRDAAADRDQAAALLDQFGAAKIGQRRQPLEQGTEIGLVRAPARQADLGDAVDALEHPADIARHQGAVDEAMQAIRRQRQVAEFGLDAEQESPVAAKAEAGGDRRARAVRPHQEARRIGAAVDHHAVGLRDGHRRTGYCNAARHRSPRSARHTSAAGPACRWRRSNSLAHRDRHGATRARRAAHPGCAGSARPAPAAAHRPRAPASRWYGCCAPARAAAPARRPSDPAQRHAARRPGRRSWRRPISTS